MNHYENFKSIDLNKHDLDLDLNLETELENFLKEKKFYCCLIFSIDDYEAIRILNITENKESIPEYNFSQFLNFNIQQENGIYKMLIENKPISNHTGSNLKTYIKDVKYELYLPIKYNNNIIGCVYLGTKEEENLDTSITELHQIIKKHLFHIMNIKMKKILSKILIENIILTNKVLEGKDSSIPRHSYSVASWAIQIAQKLNYSDEKLSKIYLAALMHDIGKIYITDKILNKQGPLTEEELKEIKKHVNLGYAIAKDILSSYDNEIPIWILQHHENWDGTGYPNKIKGEKITKEGRILKMADFLDEMFSHHSSKKQKNIEETLAELKNYSGTYFDPKIVNNVIEILNNKLILHSTIINEPLLPANLIFNTVEGLTSISGHITKTSEDLIFKLTDNSKTIDFAKLENIILAIEKLNIIYEFKVSIKKIDINKLLLKIISIKNPEKTFSLLWLINGFIIDTNTKNARKITITKISGNGLTFNLQDKKNMDTNKLNIIVVIFEDGTKIPLSGKIINKTKINTLTHYEFRFTGIKESYRDEIFRQIFRKQITLRNFLKTHS